MTEELVYEILSAVEEIPKGCVATYGQIARLVGRDKNARLVGTVLSRSQYFGDHTGRLAPGWPQQRELLRREGISFKDETHVDLKQCQWQC